MANSARRVRRSCNTPVFSPDSKRVVYEAWKGKKTFVVVDGHADAEYDGIGRGTPVFSPDSKHVVYVAINGEKQFVVVDGNADAEYDGIPGGPASRVAPTVSVSHTWLGLVRKQLVVVDGSR